MQEDAEYGYRRHEAHQEQIGLKETTTHRAPVGELILDELLRYEPAEEDARQEAADGQEDLTGDDVEDVEE